MGRELLFHVVLEFGDQRVGPRVVVGAMGSLMLVSAVLLFLTGRAKTYDHELAEP